MPAHSWATHEQLQFLRSRRADFASAQSAVPKQLNEFWKNIERDFFLQWPDQAAEAISRSKLIENEGHDMFQKKKRKKKTKATTPPAMMMPMSEEEWVKTRKHVFIQTFYSPNRSY
jgi:hypothetical protein